jgi:hypothetical protein
VIGDLAMLCAICMDSETTQLKNACADQDVSFVDLTIIHRMIVRRNLCGDGPELCPAQVENQSFYIEENVEPRALKEKASTAVITVIKCEVTAKHIENESRSAVDKNIWKWSDRKIANNKFAMRFSDAKMVHVYNNFNFLGMKAVDAWIVVEPRSPSVGAKGELRGFRIIKDLLKQWQRVVAWWGKYK